MSKVAGWTLALTVDGITLACVDRSLDEQVERLMTTDSSSLGRADCIAGIYDLTGNITAWIDSDNLPVDFDIYPSSEVVIVKQVGGAVPWSIPVMVTKVNYSVQVAGVSQYNFDYALKSSNGTPTRAS